MFNLLSLSELDLLDLCLRWQEASGLAGQLYLNEEMKIVPNVNNHTDKSH